LKLVFKQLIICLGMRQSQCAGFGGRQSAVARQWHQPPSVAVQ
jgi:hypothetical protein